MSASINGVVARASQHIDNKIRGATSEVFKNIRFMTPVDTGRARGNWHCTVGAPFAGQDATGTDGSIQAAIPLRAGSVVYLTNNVPYIHKLEYEAHSQQAPLGMVRVSVALFEGVLNGAG